MHGRFPGRRAEEAHGAQYEALVQRQREVIERQRQAPEDAFEAEAPAMVTAEAAAPEPEESPCLPRRSGGRTVQC